MAKVGVVSDVAPSQNGGRTFGEIFSRLFLEGKFNLGHKQLILTWTLLIALPKFSDFE